MRVPALFVIAAFAIGGCDAILGVQDHLLAADGGGDSGSVGVEGRDGTVDAPMGDGSVDTSFDADSGPETPSDAASDSGAENVAWYNGVVSQFQTSVHYTEYLVNISSATPETTWTTPGLPCATCHAIDALQQRVAGNVLTSDDGGVLHLASGELSYRDPVTAALSSANYAGTTTVAEVYCTTCHAITNANDPLATGIPWTPVSFPLRIAADAGTVYVEKSPDRTAVTGTNAGNFGPGDTCMWCHRSIVDVTNYLTPTGNAIQSIHWGPHNGPEADLFTGVGGYQFKGQTYGESTHEQKLSCVDCHMVNVADNGNVPDHSFNPSLSACLSCHASATSFNVSGFESQIQSALTQIETWFNAQGFLTRATAAPYTTLTAAQVGDGNWAADQPTPGATLDGGLLTQDQAGALYDYLLVARGGASGVHNPNYISQILYDSYYSLTELPLAAIPQRPQ
jgi:Cytochrome c552